MSGNTHTRLGAAAGRLSGQPGDLGAWLEIGQLLEHAGRRAEAIRTFARLGDAASGLGTAGLACACARWLLDAGADEEARALLDALVATHGRGSKTIDPGLKPRPPAPPAGRGASTPGQDVTDLDQAVDLAMQAVDAAVADAAGRRPERLPPTPLVSVLEGDDIRALVEVMTLRLVEPGAVITDVGDPARVLYWIARGVVTVTRDGALLGELRAGAFFGEIALMSGTARTARVEAVEPTWLLEIPAEDLDALAGRAPKLARVLARHARARLLANVMQTSELFSRLAEDERAELLGRFAVELVAAGTQVITKDADNHRLLVVVSGACEVRDGGELVATLGVGDGFGEMSLIGRKPAIADVIAVADSVLLVLERDQFEVVAVKHPALLAEVYKLLLERQEQTAGAIVHDADDLII